MYLIYISLIQKYFKQFVKILSTFYYLFNLWTAHCNLLSKTKLENKEKRESWQILPQPGDEVQQ